jgi:acetyl esterase/lipase
MRWYYYIFGFIVFLSACKKQDAQSTDNDPVLQYSKETFTYKQVAQTDPNLLSLDVYFDSTSLTRLKPVVIWVHGGAWCLGDKSNGMTNKKNLFASLGYILVSVNYRLSPYPYELNNPDRIKFPVHNTDVADAIKWVYNHIANYGGNPEKIVLLGHSAGAHLVSLTGTNQSFLQQSGVPVTVVKGIASIDTEAYDIYHLVQNLNSNMHINAFGNDSQENIAASPVRNIDSNSNIPRFFIAKRGNTDRLAAAEYFIQTLRQNNVIVTELEANMYTHSEINNAIGKTGENIITPALKTFLETCFQ